MLGIFGPRAELVPFGKIGNLVCDPDEGVGLLIASRSGELFLAGHAKEVQGVVIGNHNINGIVVPAGKRDFILSTLEPGIDGDHLPAAVEEVKRVAVDPEENLAADRGA